MALFVVILTLAWGAAAMGLANGRSGIPWSWRRNFGSGLTPPLLEGSIQASIGLGVSSLVYFWGLMIFGNGPLLLLFELALVVPLLWLVIRRLPAPGSDDDEKVAVDTNEMRVSTWLERVAQSPGIAGIAIGVIVLYAADVFTYSLTIPHGDWDAYSIWNLRARFLVRGTDLHNTFSAVYAWSHPDYPLLLSGSIARFWTALGNETLFVPINLALFFFCSTLISLWRGISWLASPLWGLLALASLLGHRGFVHHATSQYADVPLGLYFLLTLLLLAAFDRGGARNLGLVAMAGLTTGLAAWTKNEGILFVLAIVATRGALGLWNRRWTALAREARAFAVGFAPAAVTLVVFKLRFRGENDLFEQGFESIVTRLLQPYRYGKIMDRFESTYFDAADGLALWLLALAAIGLMQKRLREPALITPVVVLALMNLGYFAIYLITPHYVDSHLSTSLGRLSVQLWPAFVFTVFLAAPVTGARKESSASSITARGAREPSSANEPSRMRPS